MTHPKEQTPICDILPRILETWRKREIRPKFHISEQDLDKRLGGFKKGNLIILAARPGMGKTSLGLAFARNAAIDYKSPIGFFSLEMSHEQLTTRLIASESDTEGGKLKRGTLTEKEFERMQKKIGNLVDAKIFIDDTPGLSIRQFKSKARRMVQQQGVSMIFVDYIQLMSGTKGKKQNREGEISEISRGLKVVAKELDIPIMAFTQLNRSVENRGGDKKPQLADIRESGSIEQDADIVMFLYRAEYYGINEIHTTDGPPISSKGLAEIITSKHRNGSLDNTFLRFIGSRTKFVDWEEQQQEMPELTPVNSLQSDNDFFGPDNGLPNPFEDDW